MELEFLRTFTKYDHVLLPNSLVKITKKAKLIVEMLHSVFDRIPDECKASLNLERLVTHLMEFIEDSTSSRFNYELNDSYLSEYMDFLYMNLNDATRPEFDSWLTMWDRSIFLFGLMRIEMIHLITRVSLMDMRLAPEFSHHLYNLLVYLIKQKLKHSHSDVSAQNIDVAIEFLLVCLGDALGHVIHGTILNEVMEKAGSLVGDILCVIQKLIPSTII
ncbi:hypothetical protein CQW23_24151 [Capsicum baccatum]|uniref:Uncharacterized protein n=1 Tax=Capsicum baccatum TaxID=33114 RepID=A0A2G2VU09_CAPBA|nr:hypothetical protein CQW23_24151 [Capsicum baccatum]